MPDPIRLLFTGSATGAKSAAEQTVAAADTVRDAVAKANESAVSGARATVEANLKTRKSYADQAAAYLELSKQYVRGSEQQVEALRLSAAEFKKVGGAAADAGTVAIEAEKLKQTWIERTTALLLGQAAANKAAGDAAVAAAAKGASASEERGVLGAATKEAGLGRVLGGPAVVAGFVAATGIIGIVKASDEAEASQKQLANAFADGHKTLSTYQVQIDKTLKSTEDLSGYSRNDLRNTLTEAFRATDNVTKSEKMVADAANLARGRHLDLESAMKLTIRAEEGNVGALARMGIVIPKVTTATDELRNAHIKVTDANRAAVTELAHQAAQMDKTATGVKALAKLEAAYAGAAKAHQETLGGEWDTIKNKVIDYAVEVGGKLIPKLTELLGWIVKEGQALHDNKTVMGIWNNAIKDVGETIDAIVAGVKLVKKGWDDLGPTGQKLVKEIALVTAAGIALGIVLEANPFLAIATIALVAVEEIKQHWGGIAKWFQGIWDTVEHDFDTVWTWIKERAIQAELDIIEPFSHLPFGMGTWAQKMKGSLQTQLADMEVDAKIAGISVGDAVGSNMVSAFAPYADQLQKQFGGLNFSPTGGQPGNPNAKIQAPGTAFGLVQEANTLGVGSGGKYKSGGGHGGIAKPGALLDCSGYTYQVFTQNGFKDFPGTSSTQYAEMHGPNWTSEYIPRGSVEPGDLIFSVGADPPSPGHVGIVVSGSGSSAMVMQYYSTGQPPDSIPLSSIGDFVGAKRFYLVKSGAKTTTKTTTPGGSSAATSTDSSFAAAVDAAKATGIASTPPKKVPGALSASSVVSAGAAVVAQIKKINAELDKAGLDATPGEKALEARLEKLRSELVAGLGSVDTAKIKAQMKEVTTALDTEVSARIKIHEKAIAAAKKAQTAFNTATKAISTQLSAILTSAQPTVSDSGLPSAIGTSVTDLTTLGEPIDKAAQALLAKLDSLKEKLKKLSGDGPGALADRNAIKESISSWGNALNDELTKQLTKAQNAAAAAQTALDRGWRDLQTSMQRAFDAQTAASDKAFDDETTATLNQMAAQTAAKVAAAVAIVKTAYGEFTIGVGGQTPGEAALANLQQSTDATNLQQTLDDAQKELDRQTKLGDPDQIEAAKRAVVAAQTAIAEAALQVQADTERTAADQALQAEQDSIQAQGDAQAQAYQDQRTAAQAAYDQQRSDQWTALQDDLDDWQTWINTKQKTYADFLTWYSQQSLGPPPTSFLTSGSGVTGGSGSTAPGRSPGLGRPGETSFATGAYLRRPVRALVGDVPEFVVPESWLSPDLRAQVMNVLAAHNAPGARAMTAGPPGHAGGAPGGAGGLGSPIFVQVDVAGSVTTERQLSLAVRDHLVDLGRRSGGNVFGGQA